MELNVKFKTIYGEIQNSQLMRTISASGFESIYYELGKNYEIKFLSFLIYGHGDKIKYCEVHSDLLRVLDYYEYVITVNCPSAKIEEKYLYLDNPLEFKGVKQGFRTIHTLILDDLTQIEINSLITLGDNTTIVEKKWYNIELRPHIDDNGTLNTIINGLKNIKKLRV
jgi:hypothetical protein